MKKAKTQSCSLADIARATGVSTAAVSIALRNKQGVGKKLRDKIQKTARKLGYSPDSRLVAVMEATRRTRDKKLLPLVWLNNHTQEDAWRRFDYLKPYFEGQSPGRRTELSPGGTLDP